MTDSNLSKKDPGYSSDTSDLFSNDEDEKVSISDSSSTEADTDKYDDTDSEISEAEKWPAKNGDISVKVPPTTKRKIQKRFLNKYYYTMTTPRERGLVNNNKIYEYLNNTLKGSELDVENILALLEALGFKVTVKENLSGEYYGMTTPRGRALVINNKNYKDPNNTREGSEIDVDNTKALLEALGFMVIVKENLSGEEILQALRDEKQVMSHNSYGMFSFSFFGHGGKNDKIYGIDWMPVNLEEIYHLLGPAEFPGLAGKPKVLIFNACRRNRPSKRPDKDLPFNDDLKDFLIFRSCLKNWLSSMSVPYFDIKDTVMFRRVFQNWLFDGEKRQKSADADLNPDPPLSTDSENFQNFHNVFAEWLSNTPIKPDPPLDTRDFRVLQNSVKIWQSIRNADQTPVIPPNMDDFLVVFSCSEGQGSSRNRTKGSIFIYNSVKTVQKHCCHRDLPTLFEIVMERVNKATNSLQTPTLENHLRRKLMLFPGYNGK